MQPVNHYAFMSLTSIVTVYLPLCW